MSDLSNMTDATVEPTNPRTILILRSIVAVLMGVAIAPVIFPDRFNLAGTVADIIAFTTIQLVYVLVRELTRPVEQRFWAARKAIRKVEIALELHGVYASTEAPAFGEMIAVVNDELAAAKRCLKLNFEFFVNLGDAKRHAETAVSKMEMCVAWLHESSRAAHRQATAE